MSSFDIRAHLPNVVQQAEEKRSLAASPAHSRSFWQLAALVTAAHVRHLAAEEVVDANVSSAVYRALEAVGRAQPVDQPPTAMIRDIEERIDAMIPKEIAGAATLGASRVETLATALRMAWRADAAEVLRESAAFRTALLDLADVHAVTVMAAIWDRRPANPTTLAHFLGGAISPLALAATRLAQAIPWIDRSPFGAGVMAGEVMGMERDEVAASLGFTSTIPNTLDALGSVEDFVALAEALGANLAASRRLMSELLTWIRTEPTSFFLDEQWESTPEPSMPAHTTSARLEGLVLDLQLAESEARAAVDLLRSLPYGPLGAAWDAVARVMGRALASAGRGMRESAAAIEGALIVNRAYLANRAGRMYTTAADLAPFLMTEEGLPPTVARQIASLVTSRLREQNLEASAVTQDIIDSAAVMVIGRELKVEMETLGRYLAPRRFIERRDVLGSPAPERTRAWLADERSRLAADRAWVADQSRRWESAFSALEAMLQQDEEE